MNQTDGMMSTSGMMTGTNGSDVMSSTTTTMTTTPALVDDVTTGVPANAPLFIMKQITGDIPEFEIILPCIFGIFIILSLGLMVFYTKNPMSRGKEMEGKGDNQVDGKVDNSWF